jgi:hypothetical protein
MIIWLAFVTVIAVMALAIALGTSLGRQGDKEDEWHYRDQMTEAVNQLDERLKKIEPSETEADSRE